MLVSEVHWFRPDPLSAWRGEGGLPPGWGDPDVSADVGACTHDVGAYSHRVVKVPPPGKECGGVILGDHVQGVWLHWCEGHAVPCRSHLGDCWACKQGSFPRLSGYLEVWQPCDSPVLIELPSACVLSQSGLCLKTAALRSWGFLARRLQTLPGRPVLFQRSERCAWTAGTGSLPSPVDVREVLCRLWTAGGGR